MTILRLTPSALARSRFAVSPLAETLGSLICLHRSNPESWIKTWHTIHQPAYRAWLQRDAVAAGLLSLVAATKRFPDIVAIPPEGGLRTRLDAELALVTDHSDTHVRSTVAEAIAASWQDQDTAWLEQDDLAPRIADVLAYGWRQFVAPDWRRRRSILQRDIMYRAGLLAAYGWKHTISSIRDRPTWVTDTGIRFSGGTDPDRVVSDEGLIFVPRTTPGGWWTCEGRPPHYALVYPSRGAAISVDEPAENARLDALLGPGRARIVRDPIRPATSSQLADIHSLSLGTISAHLAVLRTADIAVGTRVGRTVIYQLSARGRQLLALD